MNQIGVIVICARYTTFSEEDIIEIRSIIDEISKKFGDDAINTGEIYPTNTAPVLALEDNRLTPMPVFWGFPRHDDKGVIINARCESALEKRMFSKPILTRRCVIPSTGFYEWAVDSGIDTQLSLFPDESVKNPNDPKVKYLFHQSNEKMLYMAGMIDTFTDKNGKTKDAFIILTTEANDAMKPFHDRMPVILSASECEDWVKSDSFMREVLARECVELDCIKVS